MAEKSLSAWIIGKNSYTLIISKEFAQASGFDKDDRVVIESNDKGILIKKVENK